MAAIPFRTASCQMHLQVAHSRSKNRTEKVLVRRSPHLSLFQPPSRHIQRVTCVIYCILHSVRAPNPHRCCDVRIYCIDRTPLSTPVPVFCVLHFDRRACHLYALRWGYLYVQLCFRTKTNAPYAFTTEDNLFYLIINSQLCIDRLRRVREQFGVRIAISGRTWLTPLCANCRIL